ncbi:MAG: methylenetetrahydrofolate--tRNA-(uracil(54)-C(5))-methyltransferase (FADH(2)-oxidizing) TrmFO [Deltaproteobacteria bacterium]|nr:methylenetetrahydrofolate--tRNA-(uracil(54)-C(5))-methyltransferase (FADH(2)-oxidizing) TrmFO [Myxococcales bacterium]MDP3218618.1 methylenetetrahydrofolate--tRNA-(uracil(54)-C(5))-methyltransferase (FADH(2)-oxidizing) TrmFO [Deltaproteobacteria bacterium]
MTDRNAVTVVGGGLAGCEAAWQLACRGVAVTLIEQKPHRRTPAQSGDGLCELVCSNSLRGAALTNAVGLLKEELRRAGSLILAAADLTAVPAGGALAVDRDRFSATITAAIDGHPLITRVSAEVTEIPAARPVILATGPLTGDALAKDLVRAIGEDQLAYYDAIAPIVSAESIDPERTFRQSRYDKGGDDAYINCPMNAAEYYAFIDALIAADKVAPRAFEEARYFEGCLPVEVMAARGKDTLAYGPMKPVGLSDPRTGRTPYAVVQLRQEDFAATAYNLVGFQTRMTYGAQATVFRMIPGLESAEFVRFGSVHRNTFVNAPRMLTPAMELKALPGVFLAGQITGVEGYVESAGGGFLCALLLAQRLRGVELAPPPPTTALGGLLTHLQTPREDFQPSNLTWALLPPVVDPKVRKLAKHVRLERGAQRALDALTAWLPVVAEGREPRDIVAAEPTPAATVTAASCAAD